MKVSYWDQVREVYATDVSHNEMIGTTEVYFYIYCAGAWAWVDSKQCYPVSE